MKKSMFFALFFALCLVPTSDVLAQSDYWNIPTSMESNNILHYASEDASGASSQGFDWQDRFLNFYDRGRYNKFVRSINLDFGWIPDLGDNGLGMTEVRTGFMTGLPAPKWGPLEGSFFALSPNFTYTNVHWNNSGGFPESLYKAGLSISWLKKCNERWSIMWNVSPSYAADGKESKEAVRCPVIVAATWTPNQLWKFMFGFAYLDRSDLPFLPVAGFTYTPNDDWKFELMFPRPKVARRLTAWSDTRRQRWAHIGFGLDGGTWAIESINKQPDLAMFREYSIALGMESTRKPTLEQSASKSWNLELAYVFGREIRFDHNTRLTAKFDDSLALRLKSSF